DVSDRDLETVGADATVIIGDEHGDSKVSVVFVNVEGVNRSAGWSARDDTDAVGSVVAPVDADGVRVEKAGIGEVGPGEVNGATLVDALVGTGLDGGGRVQDTDLERAVPRGPVGLADADGDGVNAVIAIDMRAGHGPGAPGLTEEAGLDGAIVP